MSVLAILGGLVLLAVASEHFVIGAARLSAALRVSMIVIGVVVVGFGTSLPEALVSGLAAGQGRLGLGIGNIVGSNVANLALLLGLAALVKPLAVASSVVRREAPITIVSVVVFTIAVQGGLDRIEGTVLAVGLVAAVALTFRGARDSDPLESEVAEAMDVARPHSVAVESVRTALGLGGTLLGAHLLLVGAVDIAERFGLSEGLVGLTLVAVGTSLPELVTIIQAARHDEPDLILGNLLGSTTFNALFVGATVALVGPNAIVDRSLTVIGPAFMVWLTVAVWALMRTGMRVARWEGALLIAVYAGFVVGVL